MKWAKRTQGGEFSYGEGGRGLGPGKQMSPKKWRCREKVTEGTVKETGRNTLFILECQPSTEAATANKHLALGSTLDSATS